MRYLPDPTPFCTANVEERTKLLVMMNEIVKSVSDEEYYYNEWIVNGVPDEADEGEIREIAEDNELYKDAVHSFLRIMKEIF